LSDGKVFVESDVAIVTSHDRIAIKRLVVACPPIPVKGGGAYDLVVVADGRPVERVSFRVEFIGFRHPGPGSEYEGEDRGHGEEDRQEEGDDDSD